jgi:hypothetical protein
VCVCLSALHFLCVCVSSLAHSLAHSLIHPCSITRVHGAGVKLDLELLEVATAGGSMLYTPTHVEFKKGLTRWMQTFSDGKLSLHHNDKTVLQLYAPDESPYYLLSMRGNAAFRDLILDKSLSNAVSA